MTNHHKIIMWCSVIKCYSSTYDIIYCSLTDVVYPDCYSTLFLYSSTMSIRLSLFINHCCIFEIAQLNTTEIALWGEIPKSVRRWFVEFVLEEHGLYRALTPQPKYNGNQCPTSLMLLGLNRSKWKLCCSNTICNTMYAHFFTGQLVYIN